MSRRDYSASAVKMSFWFSEFRKAVSLLDKGKSPQDIKDLSLSENVFSAASPARARQIGSTVCARIDALDGSFRSLFAQSDLATQKLFALAAAMASDRLFFEFVYEVVREKLILGDDALSETDFEDFFRNKQLQSEKAAAWTDKTLAKLGQVYRNMLCEAGILENTKGPWKIRKAILMPEFEQWLCEHCMESYARALTGVR